MNDSETYGVQLDLLTQNYNKKLQDVVNTTQMQAKLIEQKAKVNFEGYSPFASINDFNLDLQLTEVGNYQEQVKNVLSNLKMGNIDTSQAKASLNSLLQDVQLINDTFSKYTNTFIKINVDDSELLLLQQVGINSQLIDKYIQMTNQDLSKASENVDNLESNLGKAANEAQRLNKNTVNSNKNTSALGQNFEKSLNKGINSTSKLLFSLFSVQSVWSLISRASSNAISNNDEINSKVNVLNSALGNIMLPVVQKIVNYAEYGVIFISKVIYFFTGINALANLTTSSLKKSVSQAKELTKMLAGFDEITNIGQSSKGSLAGGIQSDLSALDDFYKKMEEVENWMQNSGIYGFLEKIRGALVTIYNYTLKPLWNYVLKPMIDYALAHPKVFTILFSIFLGTKLKNGIENIIGTESTGLKGLNGFLGKLAAIGIIAISIKLIYDSVKEASEAIQETKKEVESMAKETDFAKQVNENFKSSFISDSDLRDNISAFASLNSELSIYVGSMDSAINGYENMTTWEKLWNQWLLQDDSTLRIRNNTIEDCTSKIISNIKYMEILCNTGMLTTEQEQAYVEQLKASIEKMKEQQGTLREGTEAYSNMQSAIDEAEKSMKILEGQEELTRERAEDYIKTIQNIVDNLKNQNKDLEENSNEYELNREKIETLTTIARSFADGEYEGLIETYFDENGLKSAEDKVNDFVNSDYEAKVKLDSDTSPFKSKMSNILKNVGSTVWNTLFPNLSFGSILSKINLFDVGTNYVPNDQLAMVHKGEMIVPAKYNPATSNIGGGHDEEIIEAIYELKETLENKDMNAYISEDAIGQASSNYRSRRSRQLGKDVD